MSFMNTFAAPPIFARRACIRPMGPEPITSTVSPGPMAQRWNALYTHESGSTIAAAAKSTPAGISLRLPCRTAAAGTSRCSANPPSMLMPKAWKSAQSCVLPLTHWSQTPQPMLGATATRMPSR